MRFTVYYNEKCSKCKLRPQRVYNSMLIEAKRKLLCDECHKATLVARRLNKNDPFKLGKLSHAQLSTLSQQLCVQKSN